MANLSAELAELNSSARELLKKHDKVFTKLEELGVEKTKMLKSLADAKSDELQNIAQKEIEKISTISAQKIKEFEIKDIDGKLQDALKQIDGKLKSGKVAEAENALKLGGKTLEEVLSGSASLLQVVCNTTTQQRVFSGLSYSKPVTFHSIKVTPKSVNSKMLIEGIFWIPGGNRNANNFFLKKTQGKAITFIGSHGVKIREDNTNVGRQAFLSNDEWYNSNSHTSDNINTYGVFAIPFSFLVNNTSLEPIVIELQVSGQGVYYMNRPYISGSYGAQNTTLKVMEIGV